LSQEFFDTITSELSAETTRELELIGSGDVWIALIALLPETSEGGTVTDFIEFLEAYDPADLRFRLIQLHDVFDEQHRELIADAAEGLPGATDALLSLDAFTDSHKEPWRETLRFILEMSPEGTKELLVRTIAAVQSEAFVPHEAEFRKYLETDFRSKRAMARRISPDRLIEIATGGVSYSEYRSTRPIVLMPTMIAKPWVVVCEGSEFLVLGYPVADESLDLDPDAPPPWLAKVHKALGDERRLRILRMLADTDASLAELADDVDIAKSTLHHHLMLLRAAGLVTIHVGQDKRYSLRSDTLSEAASVLYDYIHPHDAHATPDSTEDDQ
ncbi:MAG: ArsR/SmtB family transcription factor, partial [Acidimicrobiia bacterium]